ncbi:MAG: hypothetical protein ACHQZS_07930 [Candidatus Binatales bacterium]
MKKVSFVGRVVELYRELPWSAYGRAVPEGHPEDEKPTRISLEVDGSLELAAILPPEAGEDLEVGSIVKVVLAPCAESDLEEVEG